MTFYAAKCVTFFGQRKIIEFHHALNWLRKISNFACCVLRDKVSTNFDTQNALRNVKRRRLNATLDNDDLNLFPVSLKFRHSFGN